MSEEILINVSPRETRVAIVENGTVEELLVERLSRRGLVGNIYMGKVARVLPGMQAAFVEMGLERAAFLHVADMLSGMNENGHTEEMAPTENAHLITELLKENDNIVVQVVKDPIGSKGARLTTQLSLPSRFLVFMPELDHIGVSQKIEDEAERERLKEIMQNLLPNMPGGYIIRTAAEGASFEDLRAHQEYLAKLWSSIQRQKEQASSGQILHEDLPLYVRALRDYICLDTERIRIDETASFERILAFVKEFMPSMVDKIEYYEAERPLFDLYGIEEEIQRALHRKVALKSGGHLIVDQTEAMTTIDVNTGAFVGHRNLEETIFKTNLEAASAIARQLRLRNLGGIIIIDFIDMNDESHKTQVISALEKALARDHTKNSISEVSALGLVEMTRKRTRESLEQVLCETCPTCSARGTIKTVETVCHEIVREVIRADRAFHANGYLVLAAQEVVDSMFDEESASAAQLEMQLGKSVKFQVESLYTQEQFDVVLM